MLTFECHGRIQYCAKEMQASYLPKSAKLLEFRQSNCVLSFQMKKRQNFGASVVIMSGKFIYRKYIYLFFSPQFYFIRLLGVFVHTPLAHLPKYILFMNKFIRQNFVSVTSFKTLISRLVERCLDKVLHRHCRMIEV